MITKEQKLKIFENTILEIRTKVIDSNKKRLDAHDRLEEKYRRLSIN
jgi:hypothetical protein